MTKPNQPTGADHPSADETIKRTGGGVAGATDAGRRRSESKEEIAATLERAANKPNQTADELADEGPDAPGSSF
jgi:hypothetical protein